MRETKLYAKYWAKYFHVVLFVFTAEREGVAIESIFGFSPMFGWQSDQTSKAFPPVHMLCAVRCQRELSNQLFYSRPSSLISPFFTITVFLSIEFEWDGFLCVWCTRWLALLANGVREWEKFHSCADVFVHRRYPQHSSSSSRLLACAWILAGNVQNDQCITIIIIALVLGVHPQTDFNLCAVHYSTLIKWIE